jgi:hypothetical protein
MAAPPEKPVITSPGGGQVYDSYSPLLQWIEGAGATEYDIVIRNALNVAVIKQKGLAAAEVCTAGECSFSLEIQDPPLSLANGTYTWSVLGKNVDGQNRSAKETFSVEFPGKAPLLSPDNNATTGTVPTFSWTAVDLADQYRVIVANPTTGDKLVSILLGTGDACTGDVCTFSFNSVFKPGAYRWWVLTKQASFPNTSKSEKRKINMTNAD